MKSKTKALVIAGVMRLRSVGRALGSLRLLTKRGYKPMYLASVPRLVFVGVSNWRIMDICLRSLPLFTLKVFVFKPCGMAFFTQKCYTTLE
jgi:hypothetical protein